MNISFDIPPAFRELKPGMSSDEVRTEVRARVMEEGHSIAAVMEDDIALEREKTSSLLAATGVVYAASCFGQLNGEWSTGTLTIGLQELEYSDPSVAVQGICRIMAAERGQSAEIDTLRLPCGEAALVIQQTPALRMPGELTKSGTDIPIDVAQLQAFIPVPRDAVPGAQNLVTVTFSTPTLDHWSEYSDIMADFLRSLRFSPDASQEANEEPPPMVMASHMPADGSVSAVFG